MDGDDKDKDKEVDKDKATNVIAFPGGEKLSTDEVGASYVVGQGGNVPTAELVDQADIVRQLREREHFVQSQELVRHIVNRSPVTEVVDEVVKEIAEELSHLKFERRKAASEGKNTANYTISRIASLRQLADVLLKRIETARAEQLDLKSPRFREILKLWMEFVYSSMQKSDIPDRTIDQVFRQMEADMIDWERKIIESVA